MTAEELRGARPTISGRLQWSGETDASTESAARTVEAEPARWRPVPIPDTRAQRSTAAEAFRFVLHLVVAFLSGAILLFAVTAAATLLTDGSVAILEMRGLPIFIGGAASIVVFALLRTSSSDRPAPGGKRSSAIVSVLVGLVVLILVAALLYQPAVAARMQPRIDRVLQVFSSTDEAAVTGFQQDVLQWNEDSQDYRRMLRSSVSVGMNFDQFRKRASDAETGLADLVAQMKTHAAGAQHPDLRDALDDLASVYEDQLGGLRLVNRGLLVDGIDLVRTGDTRFKDAVTRAETLFRTRLRSLLDRAGYDADSFGEAVID
jgi:multisubunit Na+/H+ antiporter MnhB subunit